MEYLDHSPPPHFNDAKMTGCCAPSAFIIAQGGGGGRGLIVPFYSVQDCSLF